MSLCINPVCRSSKNSDNQLFCQVCGSELLIAGRYRVVRLLSEKGGFGLTYEVSEHDIPKVLKVLINSDPKSIELFKKEAQILQEIDHPGIPQGEGHFIYFTRDSQTPLHCLVMEKIEGVDLEEYQRQRQNEPIDQKLAVNWLKQLVAILHEVHRHDLFHRDIKPSNIIVKPDEKLSLIDFGAARQVTATIIKGGQNTGIYTPGFAPPEQEKGYAVPQSDFYALGRTFVYLLTGKSPTDASIYDYYNDQLEWRKLAEDIHPYFAALLDRMMAHQAIQRPENTDDILQTLFEIEERIDPLNSKLPSSSLNKTVKVIGQSSLLTEPKQTGKFLLWWILANLIGLQVGLSLLTIINALGLPDILWVTLSAGSFSFLIGLVQCLTMIRYIDNYLLWLLITTMTGIIAGTSVWLGSITIGFYSDAAIHLWFFICSQITSFVLGMMQYLILRKNFDQSYWWILSYSMGLSIGYGLTSLLNLWEGLGLFFTIGIPIIMVTGSTMLWILRHKKK